MMSNNKTSRMQGQRQQKKRDREESSFQRAELRLPDKQIHHNSTERYKSHFSLRKINALGWEQGVTWIDGLLGVTN